MPARGFGSASGWGVESTWGTAVARANWYKATVGGLKMQRTRVLQPRNLLWGGASEPPVPRSDYAERETATGRADIEMHFHNAGMLLELCMGAKSTSGPSGSYYTHDFTLDPDLNISATVEDILGDSGDSEVFEGVKVDKWSLSQTANGGPLMLGMDLIGQTSAARGSAGSPSFSSNDRPVLFSQSGSFTWNSVAYVPRSYRLDVDNALGSTRPAFGLIEGQEPTRNGIMSITTTVTLEAASALYAAHLAETQSDYTMPWSGTGTHGLTITGHNCKIINISDPYDVAGVVLANVTFRHYSDGTDFGLSAALVNLNSNSRSQS